MGGDELHVGSLVEFILGGGMSIKVLVVVLAGMLFVPAACAPALIAPGAAASPLAVSSPSVLVCPVPPVAAEQGLEVPAAVPVSNQYVPGDIIAQYLVLEPNIVELGANVTLSVTVTNTGQQQGTYHLAVKIDGTVVKTQDVILAGGESRTLALTFTAPVLDGVYHVSVSDLYRELDVWS